METIEASIMIPYIFVFKDDNMIVVPTFTGSAPIACFLLTFWPSLVPLWSHFAKSLNKEVTP